MTDDSTPVTEPRLNPSAAVFGTPQDGLPPWVPQLLRRIVILVIVAVLVWQLIRALQGFFILLVISVFLAVALEPAVAYLSNRGWRRGLATGAIFIATGGFGLLMIGLMIPLVISETGRLVERLPEYGASVSSFAERFNLDLSVERLEEEVGSLDISLQSVAGGVIGGVFGVGTRVVGTFFQILTIGLFTFYLTADAPRLRRTLLSAVPAERQLEILRVVEIAIDKTGGYFYSRLLLAGVGTVVSWIAFSIIGIPFPLPLAIWLGVISQFIPIFGTYLGGILPLLIALLENPVKALWVLGFILAYQQVENYLIAPRITAHTMSLHPAVAFGAAIVGGTLLGVAGAVMALPVAATVQAFVSTYLERHELVDSHLLVTREVPAQPVVEEGRDDPG